MGHEHTPQITTIVMPLFVLSIKVGRSVVSINCFSFPIFDEPLLIFCISFENVSEPVLVYRCRSFQRGYHFIQQVQITAGAIQAPLLRLCNQR